MGYILSLAVLRSFDVVITPRSAIPILATCRPTAASQRKKCNELELKVNRPYKDKANRNMMNRITPVMLTMTRQGPSHQE